MSCRFFNNPGKLQRESNAKFMCPLKNIIKEKTPKRSQFVTNDCSA